MLTAGPNPSGEMTTPGPTVSGALPTGSSVMLGDALGGVWVLGGGCVVGAVDDDEPPHAEIATIMVAVTAQRTVDTAVIVPVR